MAASALAVALAAPRGVPAFLLLILMETDTMLRSFVRCLPLLLLAMLGGQVHASDAAVRALWSELDAAWNARDVERFSALYTGTSSFVFVGGEQAFEGRKAIHEHFSTQFSRTPPEFSHRTTISETRTVVDGVSIADGLVEILRTDPAAEDGPVVFRRFAIFALMRQAGQAWQIDVLRVYQLGDGT
jgi:uncharacterized protein (TIGR02246 family)